MTYFFKMITRASVLILCAASAVLARDFDAVCRDRLVSELRGVFHVSVPAKAGSTKIMLLPEEGVWDFSAAQKLVLTVENRGRKPFLVRGVVRALEASFWEYSKGAVVVPPGGSGNLEVLISRKITASDKDLLVSKLGDLKSYPEAHQAAEWQQIDAGQISALELEFYADRSEIDCELFGLRAEGSFYLPSEEELDATYIPPMDRFGQARPISWKGKVQQISDFEMLKQQENQWCTAHSGLPDRDLYGGWSGGKKQEATGHFYTKTKNCFSTLA